MPPVIQVSGVRKTYGSTVAVEEASFEVKDGEIFGLIGPNGAGKTTTMECIEGLRKPDRGTIAVLGLDPFSQVYKLQERSWPRPALRLSAGTRPCDRSSLATLQPRRVADRPLGPGGDVAEDPPARAVFATVWTNVRAIVRRVQAQAGDD